MKRHHQHRYNDPGERRAWKSRRKGTRYEVFERPDDIITASTLRVLIRRLIGRHIDYAIIEKTEFRRTGGVGAGWKRWRAGK